MRLADRAGRTKGKTNTSLPAPSTGGMRGQASAPLGSLALKRNFDDSIAGETVRRYP